MYMNFKSGGKPSFEGTPAEYRLRSSEYRRRLEEIGKNDPSVEDALATRYHSGGLSDQTAAEIYAFKRGKGIKEPGAETVLRTAKEPAMRHRTLHEKIVDSLSGNATQQPVSKQHDSLAEYLSTIRGRWSFLLNNCGAAKITRIHGGYLRSPAVPPTDEKWSWLYHRDHTGGRLVAYDPILPILCHRQGPQDRRRGREFSLAAACRQSYEINARNQVFDATRPSAGSSFDLEVCSE